ncbi:MAG TPA: flagellar basal body P-ring formation chaperone FlgA [Stenotrophomonas sp.]|nr:flagellar basal body P-ring formation chaperone FlgA [Stenotrophomonas sp.]
MNIRSALLLLILCLAAAPAAAGVLAGERLVETARQALQARSDGLPGHLEFRADEVPDSRIEPAEQVVLQAGELRGEWPRKRVGVPVTIRGAAREQTRMVWFVVNWWVEQPLYLASARQGAASTSLRWRMGRIDAAGVLASGDLLLDEPDLSGQRLRHAVREGDPMRLSDFEAAPLVARREPVSLKMHSGRITLTLPASAVGDAKLGEQVKVLPSGAGTPLTATVTGKGEVSIGQ